MFSLLWVLLALGPLAWCLCWPPLAMWAAKDPESRLKAGLIGLVLGPIGVVVIAWRAETRALPSAAPSKVAGCTAAIGALVLLLTSIFPWVYVRAAKVPGRVVPADLGPLPAVLVVLTIAIAAGAVLNERGLRLGTPVILVSATTLWVIASALAVAAAFADGLAGWFGEALSVRPTPWCWLGWLAATSCVGAAVVLATQGSAASFRGPRTSPVVAPVASGPVIPVTETGSDDLWAGL